MTEISFRPPGSGKIKSQTSLTFCAFTQSSRSGKAWLSGIGWMRLTTHLRASSVLKVKHEKPHEGKTPEVKDLLPHASALWDFDHF
jgi:hypothetical protein